MPPTNEQLLNQIERAIRAGRVVNVGDRTIRYCKNGQEFGDDQSGYFQALASGVFLRMPVFSGDLSKPEGYTWGYFAALDNLDVALIPRLNALSGQERGVLSAELAFTAGLASLNAERSQVRRDGVDAADESFEPSPSI
jgi:hypothetical protein